MHLPVAAAPHPRNNRLARLFDYQVPNCALRANQNLSHQLHVGGFDMRSDKLAMLAATSLLVLATNGARAADLPPPYRMLPPAPSFSWTGYYWGVNVGYGWGTSNYDASIIFVGAVSRAQNINGAIGGFQSGYNYQLGNFLIGTESDLQLSGQKGDATFPGVLGLASITTRQKLEWFGTARTRAGFLAMP